MSAPTKAWKGSCQLASAAVRGEVRKLDKQAKAGLLVDVEQRAHLGRLADWLSAAQHHGPELLAGIATQGELGDLREQVKARTPVGFKREGQP